MNSIEVIAIIAVVLIWFAVLIAVDCCIDDSL